MLFPPAHHVLLAATHGAAAAASVSCVIPRARIGAAAPPWLGWSKLVILLATASKIGILALDLRAVSSFPVAPVVSTACAVFYTIVQLSPSTVAAVLEALNSPVATYAIALASTLIDVLATSLSLTFASTLLQGTIASLACVSIVCSIWLLFMPPAHSVQAVENRLLSARYPLKSYYRLTMSIICDNLLDSKRADGGYLKEEEKEEDYLSELNEFLYARRNLSKPLHSVLWTLRKPGLIIAALSIVVALAVSAQAILIYTSLFLLSHQSSTAYAAYVHCTIGFAVLYYAMAASEAVVRQFTTRLALRLRTAVLSIVSEKIFRLPKSTATQASLARFLGTDLHAFMACIAAVPVGLINIFETILSAFGLAFIIGGFAYFILVSILCYIGFLAYATIKIDPVQNKLTAAQKKRLSEARSIIQQILAIKTLGLQAYYLQSMQRARDTESDARSDLREHTRALSMSLSTSYCAFTVMVLGGLAYRHAEQVASAEDIFPALIMLAVLGVSIGKVKLSFVSWIDFRYLQQLMNLLLEDEIPLRFENGVTSDPNVQLQIRNLTSPNASKRERLLIKDVNIELFRGDFLFVHGRTGSGKTTFLQTILGEQMASAGGSIHVADVSFAYCGQDAWIPDTSIQFCITGGNEVDATRYRRVVVACRLPPELTSLAYSSKTRVGPNGCNLSRTEKAKMLLARAAYANASIVLLDDSFAVFDAAESAELARTLLNPTNGLLRMGRSTVILASHSFAVPALIDDVYCLATSQFIEYPAEDDPSTSSSTSEEHDAPGPEPPIGTVSRSKIGGAMPTCGGECNTVQAEANRASLQKNLAFIWKTMVDQPGWKRYVCILTCMTVAEAPLVFGLFVWPQLRLPLPLSVILQLLMSIIYCWSAMATYRAGDQLAFAFWTLSHKKVATRILTSHPAQTFPLTSTQLANLLGADLEVLGSSLHKLYRFTYYSISLIFPLAILFWATNYSLAAVFGTVTCVAMVEHAWSGASKRASECSDYAMQKLNAKFAEVTEGLPYIRSFGWEKFMLRQLLDVAKDSEEALEITLSLGPWFDMTMALSWTAMATILVSYSFCHVDQISANMLGLGLLALFGLPQLARDMLSISLDIKELIAATDRIRRFMMATEEPNSNKTMICSTVQDKNCGPIPDIVFENVEVGAIVPLNGRIRNPGQLFIHGRNGSGKTALLLALLGKGDYKGSIRVGGVEVRDLSSEVISRVVSIVPQDPVTLPGTFEKNLFLTQYTHPNLAVDRLDEFLTGILDKLDLLHLTEPAMEGFQKLVCEMRLSQGQIALLNLARCAVEVLGKKTRIVVIDDMFSKLDREHADMAKAFISRAFRACIVVIAETTSDARLSVSGLTSLDADYVNSSGYDAQRIAVIDEEVRQWYKTGYEGMGAQTQPTLTSGGPSVECSTASAGASSEDAAASSANSLPSGPLNAAVPTTSPTPSADPPTSSPPDTKDPWLEPRRPAPRPPVKRQTASSVIEPPPVAVKTTIVQYDPSIFDAEGSSNVVPEGIDGADSVGKTPDREPDGIRIDGERMAMDAKQDIPADRALQMYPGAYPGRDGKGDSANEDDWSQPGSVEHKVQQGFMLFVVTYALSTSTLTTLSAMF